MDELDAVLIKAWHRIGKKLQQDRLAALKRSQRRLRPVLTHPMREWCLVIRSSDTRINADSAIIEPDDPDLSPDEALARREPHTLTISGELVRALTRPVSIPWPGVTYEESARICGREWPTIKTWIRRGVFRVNHYPEFKFPPTSKRGRDGAARGAAGRGGRPYVWTPSPIDPNNWTGRVPHGVWGTLWQHLWERFPENYVLTVRREPRWRMRRDRSKRQFRGWEFICPGMLDERGEYRGCGRRCWYLYAPQTVWTLARALGPSLGGEIGLDMPEPEPGKPGLAGTWFPGLGDPVADAVGGRRSFACQICWRIRGMTNVDSRGWNDFVTVFSGGLLYGHEVPRPEDVCPRERKHRYVPRKARASASTTTTAARETA